MQLKRFSSENEVQISFSVLINKMLLGDTSNGDRIDTSQRRL